MSILDSRNLSLHALTASTRTGEDCSSSAPVPKHPGNLGQSGLYLIQTHPVTSLRVARRNRLVGVRIDEHVCPILERSRIAAPRLLTAQTHQGHTVVWQVAP